MVAFHISSQFFFNFFLGVGSESNSSSKKVSFLLLQEIVNFFLNFPVLFAKKLLIREIYG